MNLESESAAWLRAPWIAFVLLLAGCATFAPPAKPDREPTYVQPAALPPDRAGVALVLSGGAARGYAHVGVIKALEAHGLRPDIVVGSSAGSIVGVLYASGLSAEEVDRAIAELGTGAFNDLVFPGLGFLPGEMGLIKGEKLRKFIDDRTARRAMESFPIRFAAVATNLSTGHEVAFNTGDAGLAVRASAAVPGIITPAEIGGRLYGDGQISSPLPVDAARRLGARKVIAVDVIYPPEDAFVYSAVGVVFQAFMIAVDRLKDTELAKADSTIAPSLPRTSGQFTFRDRERLIAAGEKATHEAIERLRPLFRKASR